MDKYFSELSIEDPTMSQILYKLLKHIYTVKECKVQGFSSEELSNYKAKCAMLENIKDDLETSLDEANKSAENLRLDNAVYEGQIKSLSILIKDKEELLNKYHALDVEYASCKTKLDSMIMLNQEKDSLQNDKYELKLQIKMLEKDGENYAKKIEELSAQIAELDGANNQFIVKYELIKLQNKSLQEKTIKLEAIAEEYNKLKNMNAYARGVEGETQLASIFKNIESITFENTSQKAHCGDFHISTRLNKKILVECKNYATNVNKSQITKFFDDCETNNMPGLIISLNTNFVSPYETSAIYKTPKNYPVMFLSLKNRDHEAQKLLIESHINIFDSLIAYEEQTKAQLNNYKKTADVVKQCVIELPKVNKELQSAMKISQSLLINCQIAD